MRTSHKPQAKGSTPLQLREHPVAGEEGRRGSRQHGVDDVISPGQLKEAGKILGRIERKGETLSANADRLLKRVLADKLAGMEKRLAVLEKAIKS
jgi:hypothetical protein